MSIRRRSRRRGNILVMTAFMMIGMIAVLAFSIDLGYLYVAKTELQRSADAAAMAAAWELLDEQAVFGAESPTTTENRARATAATFAAHNPILMQQPALHSDDVRVGRMNDPWNPSESIGSTGAYNAVQVRVQRNATVNGAVPMLFGRVLGVDKTPLQADAVAVTYASFGGFRTPADGSNLMILPFALDLQTWNAMLNGDISMKDEYCWDPSTGTFSEGPDGKYECNLYPEPVDDAAGNRGTVDIGSSSNSTSDLCRQILQGVSPEDMAYHGGELKFDAYGELTLNGDTGISAGVKEELQFIQGETRIIPVFNDCQGPGNNAQYTICLFVGVRVCYCNLNGSNNKKKLIVQPATVITKGGIPNTSTQSSYYVYSPVQLIR
jgi:Flp pilus assembly protein TadG